MQCAHCGQTQKGVCLDCDSHLFQVGVTLRNESAPILLKQRQQEADKKKRDAEMKTAEGEIKKLKSKLFKCQLVIIIAIAAGLLYWRIRWTPPPPPEPCAKPQTPVTRPIPFNSEELLVPGGSVSGDFPIEVQRRVTINVAVECQDCVDETLMISLLDEYNYQLLKSGQPYNPIDSVNRKSYLYTGPLERGHYFIVLEHILDSQEIVVKVKASLSYIEDSVNPCPPETSTGRPDPNCKP
jgi:hypothetical protein